MRVFFDTSALAKRYLADQHSRRVESLYDQASEVILSALCIPETLSAANRLRREGALDAAQYTGVKERLADDIASATIVEVVDEVLERSIQFLEQYTLRSMDALQLASAAVLDADVFVTADKRQALAAKGSGMRVESV